MNEQETYQSILVPAPILLKRVKKSVYGTIPDLNEDELADPDELEQQVLTEEYGPILLLPIKAKKQWKPDTDSLEYSAFNTVDFSRTMPAFNISLYKADKLKEQLGDILILFSIVNERITTKAKYLILKYLRMGIIELEHIVDADMLALARLYLRARRMQNEIADLKESACKRSRRQLKAFLES